jgi:hypothetical protein
LSGANLSEYGQEIISFDENGTGGSASGLVIQGSTHSYYHLDVGYDTTNARGFIQAGQSGAWSPLCLQPNGSGGTVIIGGTTQVNSLVCSIDGGLGLTAGNTVNLKGGANAASGTVTLTSGSGTITSTAITSSTVVFLSLKTASGTPGTYPPLTTVGTGTCVVTGLATDNSTYNWGAISVNN